MPKLTIIDDIMAPKDVVVVRFQGRNPVASALMVPGLLRDVMKISAKDIQETDVRWDAVSPDKREFYGRWSGKRQEDRWTRTLIKILIQGAQDPKERLGWARVELKGNITTTYEYSNFIQRMFWWFYNLMFYYKQRRAYMEEARDNIFEMRVIFQRTLGIHPE